MILVDSSVWIDWLGGKTTLQTESVSRFSRTTLLLVGDLMLVEVLQGCRSDRDFVRARTELGTFEQLSIVDSALAAQAARNYRTLRALGITVRKTIATLIATRCIVDGIPLLYSDRDFDPFCEHLGLINALAAD